MYKIIYKPQSGKQEAFVAANEDIVIYGGAAGGGKTYALLFTFLHFVYQKGFNGVIIRNTYTQITQAGGLWDTAIEFYRGLHPRINATERKLIFKSGATLRFMYLERDAQLQNWQGAQIQLLCFDELTHFTQKQFFYLFSRLRTAVKGTKLLIRATCNPDPDSWVRDLIEWYLDDDGYVCDDKCNTTRYIRFVDNNIEWLDDKTGIQNLSDYKSFRFIKSNIYDNKVLIEANPSYLTNLKNAGRVERARFLEGNWNVRESAGDYFTRETFKVVNTIPRLDRVVRAWDFAATLQSEVNPDPDYTVGIKVGVSKDGRFYVLDLLRKRMSSYDVENTIVNIASQDGDNVTISIPEDPGFAGKAVAENYIRLLRGYHVISYKVSQKKELRARIASSQALGGNVMVLKAQWNNVFFNELENFPCGAHDDIVDAFGDAIKLLSQSNLEISVMEKPDFIY